MATNSAASLVQFSTGTSTRTFAITPPAGFQVILDFVSATTIGAAASTTHLLLRYSDSLVTNRKIATTVAAAGQTGTVHVSFPGGHRTTGLSAITFGNADQTGVTLGAATTQQSLIVGYHFET